MIQPRRKKLIAVAIGVLLGGLPLVGFNLWLGTLLERQGRDDIHVSAQRAIGIIDARLAQVVASLDAAAARAVDSCSPEQTEVLREVAFASAPVKELAVLGPEGQTFCTTLDIALGERADFARGVYIEHLGIAFDVIGQLLARPQFLRVRRQADNGNWLAALVPVDLLLPLTASHGGPFSAWVVLSLQDGSFVAEGGSPIPSAAPVSDVLSAMAKSNRFNITVATTMAKNAYGRGNLWLVGSVVNALVVLGVVALAFPIMRRKPMQPNGEVERALAANEFIPYYQPIVDITSAKLLGAEVLVRWRKPDGSVIAPGAFIPLLEQSGLIMEMTHRLMWHVREELGPAYGRRPHLSVSFNLTAAHFVNDAVVAELKTMFGGASLRLSQIVLELTERQPLRNMTTTRRVIAALQGLGCRVALDDVGTGHSGLSSILKLGVDIIKIDKLFIDSIGNERNSATIVETLVDLARNMRMHVIAEGVEDFQQVTELRARGISAAQGYLFAPPLPGSAFLALLEAIDPLPVAGSATAAGAGPASIVNLVDLHRLSA